MALVTRDEERLTYSVIGAFFKVYNTIGFGLLEHLYVMALEGELQYEMGLLLHFGPEPVFHRLILRNDKKKGMRALYGRRTH
jgi:PD-(D/E)XK nuclease superfamily protein